MKLLAAFDSPDDPAMISPWSIIHFAAGGWARQHQGNISFAVGEALHFAYELSGGKDLFEQLGYEVKHDSSFANNVTDQVFYTLGWFFAPQALNYDIVVPAGFVTFTTFQFGFGPSE